MAEPAIKGSVFGKLVEDVSKALADGRIDRVELEARLDSRDVALLGQTIHPVGWYDIASYRRMCEMLLEVEGNGEIEYLLERGATSADRLIEMGLYQQFEYLNRISANKESDPEQRLAAYGRDLRLLCTVSSSILNFSTWTPQPDPEHPRRWMLEVTEALAYPDVLAWATVGLMNRMAERSGGDRTWHWERISPEVMHFRSHHDV